MKQHYALYEGNRLIALAYPSSFVSCFELGYEIGHEGRKLRKDRITKGQLEELAKQNPEVIRLPK